MKKTFLLLILFVSSVQIYSQDTGPRYTNKKVFPFGVVEEFHSSVLNEKRVLNIYLPDGHNPNDTETYPTIYVLDGSANEDFPHIAGLIQFMNMYNPAPKSIVVGIANVNRYRDFTFPGKHEDDKKQIQQMEVHPGF